MKSLIRTVLLTTLVIILVGIGYSMMLGFNEDNMIYYPEREFIASPEQYHLTYEDVYLQTSDHFKLHGWFFPAPNTQKTLLFFHGNAGNISGRLDMILRFVKRMGLNVFIIDYRGYGKSEGKPSEEGVYEDGRAALHYLTNQKKLGASDIILLGRSLGAAVAIDVASKFPVSKLIIENAFTNAIDVAKLMFPLWPVRLFIKSKFDCITKIKKINIPKLMIHAVDDHIIPFKLGKKLFEAASEPKEFYPVPNANHDNNYLVGGQAYVDKLKFFAFSD